MYVSTRFLPGISRGLSGARLYVIGHAATGASFHKAEPQEFEPASWERAESR
jgi:hypothetical protein